VRSQLMHLVFNIRCDVFSGVDSVTNSLCSSVLLKMFGIGSPVLVGVG